MLFRSAETEGEPLRGAALARSEGIRRVVGHLLVRDPRKRSRVADLWIDEWMHGEGAPPPPALQEGEEGVPVPAPVPSPMPELSVSGLDEREGRMPIVVRGVDGAEVDLDADADADVDADADADADEEGVLVDGEDIGPGSVARQEH